MKKIIVILLAVLLSNFSMNAENLKKYGKEITLKEKTPISKIIENPESFVGKKVLVEGKHSFWSTS